MTQLIINSLGLGVGLAMDAFSVSLTNGLSEPYGTKRRAFAIASVYALFQMAMPLLGWLLVTTMENQFAVLSRYIPYVALALLLFIGGKMLIEGICEIKNKKNDDPNEKKSAAHTTTGDVLKRITFAELLVQGVATSIDALSVGLQIADYAFHEALLSAAIIAAVTLAICFAGVLIGRKFGTKLSEKATVLGGVILIGIGIKIFLDGIL